MTAPGKPETVRRCVTTLDGSHMIVTPSGSGSSPVPIPAGARVVIDRGVARRVSS